MSTSPQQPPSTQRQSLWQIIRPFLKIALGVLYGVLITLSVQFVVEIATGREIPLLSILPFGCLITPLLTIRCWTRDSLDPSHDWKILSLVANSKAMMLITIALSVVPLVLSISQATHKQDLLPFDIYLYWLSGLSFFCFMAFYKATAPQVFKYTSYRDLIDREGSTRVLRESVADLQERATNREASLTADIQSINSLDVQNTQHQEHIFFLLREYSKNLKSWARLSLSVLLVVPTFFVITITLSKAMIVGHELNQTVPCYGGWIKATYWGMLKTNPLFITQQDLDNTQQCLQNVAGKSDTLVSQ